MTALRSIVYSCSGGGGGGGGDKEHTAVLPSYILSNDHLKVYIVHTLSAPELCDVTYDVSFGYGLTI